MSARGRVGWLDRHCRQSDEEIIAQGGHGFRGHVAGALDGPFVLVFEEDGADQADDGPSLGKMLTTSVRRLISPLSRSRRLVECSFDQRPAGKLR
jgi:hypothetical protein